MNACAVSMITISIPALMPVTREEKIGQKAWKQAAICREIGGFIELIWLINLILWIWFPIPQLDWILSKNILIGIIIGIIIAAPSLTLLLLGMKAAGKESLSPSKKTEMFGGIYRYIRHPQNLGEFLLFLALPFIINTLFLIIWMLIVIIILLPLLIYIEEKDLIKRFGDSYLMYKRNTGAIFPKFKSWDKNKENK